LQHLLKDLMELRGQAARSFPPFWKFRNAIS
jgi:hypothetical protein